MAMQVSSLLRRLNQELRQYFEKRVNICIENRNHQIEDYRRS